MFQILSSDILFKTMSLKVLFLQKNVHNWIWRSPDGKTVNQIDRILISSRNRSNVMDVRSYREARGSVHYLVIAGLRDRISLVNNIKGQTTKRYNIVNLKEYKSHASYLTNLEDGMHRLEISEESSIDERWKK